MQVIVLKDPEILKYLHHVFASHTAAGIAPAELAIAAETYAALSNAVDVPEGPEHHLGDAKITDIRPDGLTLEVQP